MHRFLGKSNVTSATLNVNQTALDQYNTTGIGLSKPLGDAIAAAILIQMLTFSGLLVVGVTIASRRRQRKYRYSTDTLWQYLMDLIVPSLAAGSMLAATFFLIIPEAMDLLGGRHGDSKAMNLAQEKKATWMFGTAMLCGFLFPIFLSAICPTPAVKTRELYGSQDVPEPTVVHDDREVTDYDTQSMAYSMQSFEAARTWYPEKYKDRRHSISPSLADRSIADTTADPSVARPQNIPLAMSILIGDTVHNLSDGLFLGTAFLLCSRSLAWIMVATTLYSQLAQEMADYVLLTQHCGLDMCHALTLNFLSGCGVLVGVWLVFIINLPHEAVGAILSGSAGVYLNIAIGECLPRIQAVRKTGYDSLVFFSCFIVGAVPIGLILLNDVQCGGS